VNCVEILRPFGEALDGATDVQLMGGISSLALTNPETKIDTLTNTVVAPSDFFIPNLRDNNTLRDVDVLVTSSDQSRVDEVASLLRSTVGSSLERSVFGLRKYEALQSQIISPLGFKALSTFVSDRYERPNGQLFKAVFPFSVPIDPTSLEPWNLEVNGHSFLIPHPGMTLINYSQRSIAGLRDKDKVKLGQIKDKVYSESPEIKGWIMDGPGASQVELTRIINSLAERGLTDELLPESGRYTRDELADHEAFLLRDHDSPFTRRAALAVASFKAVNLGRIEANPALVSAWQSVGGALQNYLSGARR